MKATALLAESALEVSGIVPLGPKDGLPPRFQTLLLISPAEPGFWPHFQTSDEVADGAADPLDRWSRRVIGRIACDLGGKAYFPFGGAPWHPFVAWAHRSGRAHPSPVRLLVHDRAGLFLSYRGAIAVEEALPSDPSPSPCVTCVDQPCRTACPVGALTADGFDSDPCRAYLDTAPGATCVNGGCQVRRACPVGRNRRQAAQSAFHMEAFRR